MKTITFNSTAKIIRSKGIVLCFSLFAFSTGFAQLQNNGTLYVRDNGILTLKSGNYGFGTGTASTATTRTANTYGKIVFGSGTTSSGATNIHFIDGFARTLGFPYTMNLGQTGVLAPLRIVSSTGTSVDAAFYNGTPTDNLDIDTELSEISNSEYWDIQGANSIISLSWRPSTIANLTTSVYTIVGYNSSTGKWDIIPSTVDVTSFLGGTSTPAGGSITSDGNVNFTTYRFFTIGSKGEPCAPLVPSNDIVKRWTGTQWVLDSNNEPTTPPSEFNPVIIAGAYANGSFSCNSLVLNANVNLANGQFIDCVNGVTGDSKIIMASEANFVQRNNSISATAPLIELNKKTREDMRRFDYIYWGTPVTSDISEAFNNSQAGSQALINPNLNLGAFDNFLKYVSGLASTVSGWQPLNEFIPGSGFIARIKQQAPFTNAVNEDFINVKISGTANNGIINVPITNNPSAPFSGASHNLLANPYPSAIDADKFLVANEDIDGVVYIWTAGGEFYPGAGSYSQSDYISYTRLGSTATNGVANTFNGKIASGQGFKVRSLQQAGTAVFNNCMRLTTDNDQFYKASSNTIDRYKITMTGANGVYSQVLVGYTPETTLGYDRMYDATRNSVSTAQVYTLLDNTTRRLAINARPSFVNTDKVALGILKNNTNAETFTFTIDEKEGIFNTNQVTVYLRDKVQNTYHNLNNGPFTYTSSVTNLGNRFELVYQTDADLSNPEFDTTKTFVSLNDNVFKANSSAEMSSITIYDIAGRLIATYNNVNSNTFTTDFNKVQGVYIAKIKLMDGTLVNQKVINK